MKVVTVIDSLAMGGAQKLLVTYARNKSEGVVLTVITLSERNDESVLRALRRYGATVHSVPGCCLLSPRRILRIIKLLKAAGADIVHTHLTYANIIGTWSARLASVSRVFSTLHTTGVDRRHYHPLRHWLETFALRFCSAQVLAVGSSVADAHAARLGAWRIRIVTNPVEVSRPVPPQVRGQRRKDLLLEDDRFVIMSVGRLSPPKGYDILVSAVDKLRRSHPGVQLVVVGEGMLRAELEEQISSRELGEHVFLLGQREDVRDLLAAADVFVSSSHWEGLSIAMLEAMAEGVAIVATEVGDASLLLADGRGLLVPPGSPDSLVEALRRVIEDPELRIGLGTAARQYVQSEHDVVHWVGRIEDLYAAGGDNYAAGETGKKGVGRDT